jgi:hypothetical protein
MGGSLSLATIAVFGFLLRESMVRLPVPGSNGRMSPIEAVVERLNRATAPDTPISGPEEVSGSTSVRASEPRPWPPAAASTSKSHQPALLTESGTVAGGQSHIVLPTQNPNERSLNLMTQLPVGKPSLWRGTLIDAFGLPVRSAEVHLIGGHGELMARTSVDGSFAFSELTPGDYEVVVVLEGREVGYLKALHLSAISSRSRLTLSSGGRVLVSRPGKLP